MKRTLTVNLNNIVFHIDDDAYDMLQTYLHEISDHFSEEDERKEIMTDIEARIAELFNEKLQKNKNVINLADVQEVIEVMGKPSQYTDEEENHTPGDKQEKKTHGSRARRFYRDPENAILGGVAGGMSAYFNIDVTIIRIVLVVLVFVGVGFVIPVYIVMWIVAPEAVTASQRLEMQGEDVTVESIKTELNNAKSYVQSDKFKESASKVGTGIGHAAQVIGRVLAGIVGSLFGLVGVVLIGVLILLLVMFVFHPGIINGFGPEIFSNWQVLTTEKLTLLTISLILVAGCPIFLMVYWAIRIISGRRSGSNTATWVVGVLWLAGLFMFYSVGAETFGNLRSIKGSHLSLNWDEDNEPKNTETRAIASFNAIEVSGNIEVEFTRDDSLGSLTIEASKAFLPKIVTKVENGVLRIYSDEIFLNRTARVRVAVDSLTRVECSGASRVTADDPIKAANLVLKVSGAGDVSLNVKGAKLVDVDVSGASKADLNGSSEAIKVECTGASNVDAEALETKTAYVRASGASDASVFASVRLDAGASGASHIGCKGSPKLVNKNESGGADVDVQ